MSDEGAKGARAHGPDCECPRCVGFTAGPNGSGALARTTHGAYAVVGLEGEAAEVAERIREVVPVLSPADEVAIEGLSIVTVRVRRAAAAIREVDEAAASPLASYAGNAGETISRLRDDLRRWLALSLKYAEALGLTPTSRARLGLDIAATKRALTVVELHAQAAVEAEALEEGAA